MKINIDNTANSVDYYTFIFDDFENLSICIWVSKPKKEILRANFKCLEYFSFDKINEKVAIASDIVLKLLK